MSHFITRTLLEASLALTPKSASEMRRDAELMYDGPIPHDVLAAIEEQSRREFVPVSQRVIRDHDIEATKALHPKEPTLKELNARLSASIAARKAKGLPHA